MKMSVLMDCTPLGAWERNPRGYVVVKASRTSKVEAVETGKRIALVRVPANIARALRQLEKIREAFDTRPNGGMSPCVVVVPANIAADERSRQFFRRAAMIVEV